jgi:hypothetical protein
MILTVIPLFRPHSCAAFYSCNSWAAQTRIAKGNNIFPGWRGAPRPTRLIKINESEAPFRLSFQSYRASRAGGGDPANNYKWIFEQRGSTTSEGAPLLVIYRGPSNYQRNWQTSRAKQSGARRFKSPE